MTVLVSLILACALVGGLLVLVRRTASSQRIADTPPAQDARATEQQADAAAEARHAEEVRTAAELRAAAEAKAQAEHDAAMQERPTDVFREIARQAEERDAAKPRTLDAARRIGPLLVVLALLPAPARAEDPFVDGVAEHADGSITLSPAAARAVQLEITDLRQALADAVAREAEQVALRAADARKAEADLAAARARIAALEALPAPETGVPWRWIAGGAAAGALVVLGIVVLTGPH